MKWQARAECRTAPLAAFFPPDLGRGRPRKDGTPVDPYADARPYCARCPVVRECLEHSLSYDVQAGFAAGRTPRERELLRGLR